MSSLVKALVGLKLLMLVLFVLIQIGWVKLGELPLFAKMPEALTGADAVATSDKSVETKSATTAEEPAPSEDYLENLLELPKLTVDGLKKEELVDYLQKAQTAKEQVDSRIKHLEEHIQLLHNLEESIEKKLEKIEEEKSFMAASEQKEKQVQNDRLTTIIELYEKMEPKKAGPLLEKMDKDLVVAVFQKLKKKQVTKFLESMSEAKAVEITEYFGRLSSLKEYQLLKEMNRSLVNEFAVCKVPRTGVETPEDESETGEVLNAEEGTPAASGATPAAPANPAANPETAKPNAA